MKGKIINIFKNVFNCEPQLVAFSPGRINLMGEHLDYNGGSVLPCSISLGIYGAISLSSSNKINLYSSNVKEGILKYDIDRPLELQKNKKWSDYIAGIIWILKKEKFISLEKGFNMVIFGDLPNSSGLSSSAALETLAIFLINELYHLKLSKIDLAILAKKCENDFIGVKCGIMDQFSVVFGKSNKAIYLNSQNINDFRYVSLENNDYSFLIVNSNLKRNLASSKYNQRYQECQEILKIINEKNGSDYLYICNFPLENKNYYLSQIDSELLKNRFKHIIEENERTKNSAYYLENNDFLSFGEIMYESHESLKKFYEVSCAELDEIVEIAYRNNAIGARMTGAGFGGCVIILAKISNIKKLKEKIKELFFKKFNFYPSMYIVNIADGTHLL